MKKPRAKKAKAKPRAKEPKRPPELDALVESVREIDGYAPGLNELEVAKVLVRRGFGIVDLLRAMKRGPAAVSQLEELAAQVLFVRGHIARFQ